jgi:hypothetical protein
MSGDLLGVLKSSVVFQVDRDAGCPPHHPADSGDDRATAQGHHLQPCLRHGRVSGCGWGVYLRTHYPETLRDDKLRKHFHENLFHGFDFDNTMLRIGSMNMLLQGVENSAIIYRDSLAQDHAGEIEKYTLVLANPPFAGSLDYESTAKDLLEVVKTKKTELLFLALFLRLLKPGGRAAVIVPDGVCCSAPPRRTKSCVRLWSSDTSSTPSLRCPPACSGPTRASRPPS